MTWSVVLGATGAIGRVVAARLTQEGHDVLAVARDERRLAALVEHGDAARGCPVDLTDPDVGRRILEAMAERPVRLLAHLASAPLGGHILETDDAVIRASLEVKVMALLRVIRALGDRFTADGRVVAVGGNLGFDPVPGASTAGLANAAQANAIRQLNQALAPRGVTCHTVAPGPVDTERYRIIARDEAARRGIDVEDVVREAATDAPLRRLTRPEDVAWAIARLADPEAAVLAGSTLLLDAGRRTAIP